MPKDHTRTRGSPGVHPSRQISYRSASDTLWPEEPRDVAQALDQLGRAPSRQFFNGTFLESFDALITSDGATITMTLTNAVSGDLTMNFSDGQSTFSTSSGNTIALTAGTQATPVTNFIYILQSDKILTKSTVGFPSVEHIKVGVFVCQTAALVQSPGPLATQNINDHAMDTSSVGHLNHIAERLRASYAIYQSGMGLTVTGGVTLDIAIASGVAYQMHKHATTAFDTAAGDLLHVVNAFGAGYSTTSDPETLLTDSANGSMSNKYYNLVFIRILSKSGEYSPVFCNLPAGSYIKQTDAENDVSGYDTYAIPPAYTVDSSTGLLLYRITLKHAVAGGTWTHLSTKDLRGSTPVSLAGTGTGTTLTEFSDGLFKIFNASDATKLLVANLSGATATKTVTIASAHTDDRTVTLPDATDTLVGKATTDTLTNKTLTTPTVGNFTNATHSHQNAAGGGALSAAAITSGVLASARGGSGTERLLFRFPANAFIVDPTSSPSQRFFNRRPALVFTDTLAQNADTPELPVPGDYSGGTVKARIFYCVETATTDLVAMEVYVEAVTPNVPEAPNMLTTDSYGAANAGTDTVPGTATYLASFDITLADKDNMAVGDLVRFLLLNDNANQTCMDDPIVFAMYIFEDLS